VQFQFIGNHIFRIRSPVKKNSLPVLENTEEYQFKLILAKMGIMVKICVLKWEQFSQSLAR
jgi:hypothetical protein